MFQERCQAKRTQIPPPTTMVHSRAVIVCMLFHFCTGASLLRARGFGRAHHTISPGVQIYAWFKTKRKILSVPFSRGSESAKFDENLRAMGMNADSKMSDKMECKH